VGGENYLLGNYGTQGNRNKISGNPAVETENRFQKEGFIEG